VPFGWDLFNCSEAAKALIRICARPLIKKMLRLDRIILKVSTKGIYTEEQCK
jgi:hypothetical protein